MPYVPVPKDLTRIQTKVAFGLTKRQLIGAVAAVAVGALTFLTLREPLGDLALYLALALAAPCFLAGFHKSRDGRPLEKILQNYIRVRYVLPRVRPYRTSNIYQSLMQLHEIQEEINHARENQTGQAARPLCWPFQKRQKAHRGAGEGGQAQRDDTALGAREHPVSGDASQRPLSAGGDAIQQDL